jgi:hypothetical protein
MRTQLACGAGIIARSELRDPSQSLAADVDKLKCTVSKQEVIVTAASDAFHASLAGGVPQERQLALKSTFDLESARLEHLRQELRGKQGQLDFAEGQGARFNEQRRLESDFVAAGKRLDVSRAAITELQELQRGLPDKLASATLEFTRALQSWNERKAAVDATKWQRAANESH